MVSSQPIDDINSIPFPDRKSVNLEKYIKIAKRRIQHFLENFTIFEIQSFFHILLFSTIGAYALRNSIIDVYSMFIAGIAGYFMRRWDYSIPAVVMGVILGQIGENAFSQAITMLDYRFVDFFGEPIAGVLIGIGLATIVWNIFHHSRAYMATYRSVRPLLRGDDLPALGVPPGKAVGEVPG